MRSTVTKRALHVVAAAARLAALYAFGVMLLLLALILWNREWIGNMRGVLQLNGFVFGSLFAAALLLLATARRVGFAMLWVLLIGLWLWLTGRIDWSPLFLVVVFVFWSIVALPLYLLGAVGFPGRHRLHVSRWTTTIPALVAALWVALVVFTVAVTPAPYLFVASVLDGSFGKPPAWVLTLAPVIWAPAPMLIGLEALIRLRPVGTPTAGGLTSA